MARGSTVFLYGGDGNLIRQINGPDVIDFIYDESGVCGITRGSSQYYFRKNVQGDVTHIYSVDGQLCAQYVYDAWGNHKVLNPDGTENTSSTFIGNVNPIRYRGYYYDAAFGLYYLQTRYYDPETGRFISQDDYSYLAPETINGLNLYAYCNNNPVMNVDPTGRFAFLVFLVAAAIGFAVAFVASAVSQAVTNDGEVNYLVATIDGIFGAISAALWMIPGLGAVATGFITAGLTAVNGLITTGIEKNWNYSLEDGITIASSAILAGIIGGVTRWQYIKGGRLVLTKTHKFVGTIEKRIVSGYYNKGMEIFSKSLKSASGQTFRSLANLNFGKGFYKDWIVTGLQALFSTAFSRGLNGLKW